MSRIGWVLIALLSLLLIVGWFFLIYQPTSEDIEDVRAETEQVRTQTTQQLARAAQLREVRQAAPESEAALSAGQLLIPEAASVPALFRQMQQVADESGVRLVSISPSAPAVQQVGETEVAVISLSMALEGSYFQIVDLARRIEDPQIMSRALLWRSASLIPSEFPELSVTLSGDVFARGTEALPMLEEEEPPAEEVPDDGEDGDDVDGDPDEDLEVEP